jgi:hypothetical protein
MKTFRILLLTSALVASSAFAQEVTLRLNPKQGAKYTFETQVQMKGSGPMNTDLTQRMKQVYDVKSVTANGVKINVRTTEAKVTVPKGSPMEKMASQMETQMKSQPLDMELDRRGKLLKIGGRAADVGMRSAMGMSGQGGMMNMEFPQGPVKVGTSWQVNVDMASMMGGSGAGVTGGKFPIKYRVAKIERQGNRTLVTVAYSADGKMGMSMGSGNQAQKGDVTMKMSGNAVLDAADGLPINSTFSSTINTKFGGMAMNQNVSGSMKRL